MYWDLSSEHVHASLLFTFTVCYVSSYAKYKHPKKLEPPIHVYFTMSLYELTSPKTRDDIV